MADTFRIYTEGKNINDIKVNNASIEGSTFSYDLVTLAPQSIIDISKVKVQIIPSAVTFDNTYKLVPKIQFIKGNNKSSWYSLIDASDNIIQIKKGSYDEAKKPTKIGYWFKLTSESRDTKRTNSIDVDYPGILNFKPENGSYSNDNLVKWIMTKNATHDVDEYRLAGNSMNWISSTGTGLNHTQFIDFRIKFGIYTYNQQMGVWNNESNEVYSTDYQDCVNRGDSLLKFKTFRIYLTPQVNRLSNSYLKNIFTNKTLGSRYELPTSYYRNGFYWNTDKNKAYVCGIIDSNNYVSSYYGEDNTFYRKVTNGYRAYINEGSLQDGTYKSIDISDRKNTDITITTAPYYYVKEYDTTYYNPTAFNNIIDLRGLNVSYDTMYHYITPNIANSNLGYSTNGEDIENLVILNNKTSIRMSDYLVFSFNRNYGRWNKSLNNGDSYRLEVTFSWEQGETTQTRTKIFEYKGKTDLTDIDASIANVETTEFIKLNKILPSSIIPSGTSSIELKVNAKYIHNYDKNSDKVTNYKSEYVEVTNSKLQLYLNYTISKGVTYSFYNSANNVRPLVENNYNEQGMANDNTVGSTHVGTEHRTSDIIYSNFIYLAFVNGDLFDLQGGIVRCYADEDKLQKLYEFTIKDVSSITINKALFLPTGKFIFEFSNNGQPMTVGSISIFYEIFDNQLLGYKTFTSNHKHNVTENTYVRNDLTKLNIQWAVNDATNPNETNATGYYIIPNNLCSLNTSITNDEVNGKCDVITRVNQSTYYIPDLHRGMSDILDDDVTISDVKLYTVTFIYKDIEDHPLTSGKSVSKIYFDVNKNIHIEYSEESAENPTTNTINTIIVPEHTYKIEVSVGTELINYFYLSDKEPIILNANNISNYTSNGNIVFTYDVSDLDRYTSELDYNIKIIPYSDNSTTSILPVTYQWINCSNRQSSYKLNKMTLRKVTNRISQTINVKGLNGWTSTYRNTNSIQSEDVCIESYKDYGTGEYNQQVVLSGKYYNTYRVVSDSWYVFYNVDKVELYNYMSKPSDSSVYAGVSSDTITCIDSNNNRKMIVVYIPTDINVIRTVRSSQKYVNTNEEPRIYRQIEDSNRKLIGILPYSIYSLELYKMTDIGWLTCSGVDMALSEQVSDYMYIGTGVNYCSNGTNLDKLNSSPTTIDISSSSLNNTHTEVAIIRDCSIPANAIFTQSQSFKKVTEEICTSNNTNQYEHFRLFSRLENLDILYPIRNNPTIIPDCKYLYFVCSQPINPDMLIDEKLYSELIEIEDDNKKYSIREYLYGEGNNSEIAYENSNNEIITQTFEDINYTNSTFDILYSEKDYFVYRCDYSRLLKILNVNSNNERIEVSYKLLINIFKNFEIFMKSGTDGSGDDIIENLIVSYPTTTSIELETYENNYLDKHNKIIEPNDINNVPYETYLDNYGLRNFSIQNSSNTYKTIEFPEKRNQYDIVPLSFYDDIFKLLGVVNYKLNWYSSNSGKTDWEWSYNNWIDNQTNIHTYKISQDFKLRETIQSSDVPINFKIQNIVCDWYGHIHKRLKLSNNDGYHSFKIPSKEGNATPATLVMDIGLDENNIPYSINSISGLGISQGSAYMCNSVNIEYSVDGTNWTLLTELYQQTYGNVYYNSVFDTPIQLRYLRIRPSHIANGYYTIKGMVFNLTYKNPDYNYNTKFNALTIFKYENNNLNYASSLEADTYSVDPGEYYLLKYEMNETYSIDDIIELQPKFKILNTPTTNKYRYFNNELSMNEYTEQYVDKSMDIMYNQIANNVVVTKDSENVENVDVILNPDVYNVKIFGKIESYQYLTVDISYTRDVDVKDLYLWFSGKLGDETYIRYKSQDEVNYHYILDENGEILNLSSIYPDDSGNDIIKYHLDLSSYENINANEFILDIRNDVSVTNELDIYYFGFSNRTENNISLIDTTSKLNFVDWNSISPTNRTFCVSLSTSTDPDPVESGHGPYRYIYLENLTDSELELSVDGLTGQMAINKYFGLVFDTTKNCWKISIPLAPYTNTLNDYGQYIFKLTNYTNNTTYFIYWLNKNGPDDYVYYTNRNWANISYIGISEYKYYSNSNIVGNAWYVDGSNSFIGISFNIPIESVSIGILSSDHRVVYLYETDLQQLETSIVFTYVEDSQYVNKIIEIYNDDGPKSYNDLIKTNNTYVNVYEIKEIDNTAYLTVNNSKVEFVNGYAEYKLNTTILDEPIELYYKFMLSTVLPNSTDEYNSTITTGLSNARYLIIESNEYTKDNSKLVLESHNMLFNDLQKFITTEEFSILEYSEDNGNRLPYPNSILSISNQFADMFNYPFIGNYKRGSVFNYTYNLRSDDYETLEVKSVSYTDGLNTYNEYSLDGINYKELHVGDFLDVSGLNKIYFRFTVIIRGSSRSSISMVFNTIKEVKKYYRISNTVVSVGPGQGNKYGDILSNDMFNLVIKDGNTLRDSDYRDFTNDIIQLIKNDYNE